MSTKSLGSRVFHGSDRRYSLPRVMAGDAHYNRLIWGDPAPGRLLGPGHPVGDFLEAHDWRVLEERPGYFKVDVSLVPQVKNFKGHLFGGYAPTYVDLIALRTVSAGRPLEEQRGWLLTVNMRVDYFEPVKGPRFVVESEIVNRRRRILLVETRFRDAGGTLLLFALTTLRESEEPIGTPPEAGA